MNMNFLYNSNTSLLEASYAVKITQRYSAMDAGHHVLGMARFSSFQNQKIYIMTIVVGIVSILTAIITIYWFAMMRRNFRQQYVHPRIVHSA